VGSADGMAEQPATRLGGNGEVMLATPIGTYPRSLPRAQTTLGKALWRWSQDDTFRITRLRLRRSLAPAATDAGSRTDQLGLQGETCRSRARFETRSARNGRVVTFVDEIGFERKPRKLRAPNADVVIRLPLELSE
jgi:hypothetical protein